MEPGNNDCQPILARRLRGAAVGGVWLGQLSLLDDVLELEGELPPSRERPSASPPLPPPLDPSWLLAEASTECCIEVRSWASASMADAAPMLPTHRTLPIKNFPTHMAAQPLDPQSKSLMLAEMGSRYQCPGGAERCIASPRSHGTRSARWPVGRARGRLESPDASHHSTV